MRRLALLIACLICLGALAPAQQTLSDPAGLKADWGPKLSSPGTTVEARKMPSRHTAAGTLLDYRLFAAGFPAGAILQLATWPISDARPSITLEGVTLDQSGLAICAGTSPHTCGSPQKPNDPIDLKFYARLGEPLRLALATSDFKVRAFTTVVPFPIVATDHGCRLEAIVESGTGAVVLIRGAGFPPRARVRVDTASAGLHRYSAGAEAPLTSAAGTFTSVLMPMVASVGSGVATFRAAAQHCAPELRVAWGPASSHPE